VCCLNNAQLTSLWNPALNFIDIHVTTVSTPDTHTQDGADPDQSRRPRTASLRIHRLIAGSSTKIRRATSPKHGIDLLETSCRPLVFACGPGLPYHAGHLTSGMDARTTIESIRNPRTLSKESWSRTRLNSRGCLVPTMPSDSLAASLHQCDFCTPKPWIYTPVQGNATRS
jgi:hypothetical protein